MTTKWYFVEFEHAVPHTVPEDYLKPLIKDLTKRRCPLETRLDRLLPADRSKEKTAIRPRNWLSLDLGGFCLASEPRVKIALDGLRVHVPCNHVGAVIGLLERLRKDRVRFFTQNKPYIKAHVWVTTVVLHLTQADELIRRLKRIEKRANARANAHTEAWKTWMDAGGSANPVPFEEWLKQHKT